MRRQTKKITCGDICGKDHPGEPFRSILMIFYCIKHCCFCCWLASSFLSSIFSPQCPLPPKRLSRRVKSPQPCPFHHKAAESMQFPPGTCLWSAPVERRLPPGSTWPVSAAAAADFDTVMCLAAACSYFQRKRKEAQWQ